MKKMLKNKKGITLISLVVTIIILLILAGISIGMLSGDNGVLRQAGNAKTQTDIAEEKEILQIASLAAISKEKYGDLNKDKLDAELNKDIGENNYSSKQIKKGIQVTYISSNRTYIIYNDGNVKEYEIPIETPIYAKLYEDGTLILSSIDYTDSNRTLKKDFRELTNKAFANYYSSTTYASLVTKVIIYNEIVPITTSYWFSGLNNLSTIENIDNINTELVTEMTSMFSGCKSLARLDLNSFDTENVTKMDSMFDYCENLTDLKVSGFDTSNVETMSTMFRCCSFDSINVKNFDTRNVKYMENMFRSNKHLTELDLSSFDTSKVTNMESLFRDCSELTTIYIVNDWNISNLNTSTNMFYNCKKLMGGSGTNYRNYSVNTINATYAHIDGGTSNPGYFTAK